MGQSECKGCSSADPVTDTVKVNVPGGATLLTDAEAGKASPKQAVSEEQLALQQQLEQEEQARREAEEQRLREAQEEEEKRRRALEEEQEQGRLREEQRRRQEAEEQQRLEEQRLREEAELAERQAAEKLAAEQARAAEEERRRVAEEQAKKEAQQKVDVFMKKRGFKTLAMPRTSCFKASYPLHVAVQENLSGDVSAMLLCGADKTVKNSAGKTPLEVAEKLNKNGSHAAVISALR